MPNHVKNIITFKGDPEKIQAILEQIQHDEEGFGSFDFNKLIPMPSELQIEAGSRTDEGLKLYRDFMEIYSLGKEPAEVDALNVPAESEEAFLRMRTDIDRRTWELGKQAFQNVQRFGCDTWYSWCNRHWNTKWNAYDCFHAENRIGFNTAWSAPHPVIEKLAERFPEAQFTHEWADEDIGNNCGRREYAGGQLVEESFPADGREAYEFSASVWDEDLLDFGLVLNSDGSDYVSVNGEDFDGIEVCGQAALFSKRPLSAQELPCGLYQYFFQQAEDGGFVALRQEPAGKFGGCLITADPVSFGAEDRITFTDDNSPAFTGQKLTFEDLIGSENSEGVAWGGMQL